MASPSTKKVLDALGVTEEEFLSAPLPPEDEEAPLDPAEMVDPEVVLAPEDNAREPLGRISKGYAGTIPEEGNAELALLRGAAVDHYLTQGLTEKQAYERAHEETLSLQARGHVEDTEGVEDALRARRQPANTVGRAFTRAVDRVLPVDAEQGPEAWGKLAEEAGQMTWGARAAEVGKALDGVPLSEEEARNAGVDIPLIQELKDTAVASLGAFGYGALSLGLAPTFGSLTGLAPGWGDIYDQAGDSLEAAQKYAESKDVQKAVSPDGLLGLAARGYINTPIADAVPYLVDAAVDFHDMATGEDTAGRLRSKTGGSLGDMLRDFVSMARRNDKFDPAAKALYEDGDLQYLDLLTSEDVPQHVPSIKVDLATLKGAAEAGGALHGRPEIADFQAGAAAGLSDEVLQTMADKLPLGLVRLVQPDAGPTILSVVKAYTARKKAQEATGAGEVDSAEKAFGAALLKKEVREDGSVFFVPSTGQKLLTLMNTMQPAVMEADIPLLPLNLLGGALKYVGVEGLGGALAEARIPTPAGRETMVASGAYDAYLAQLGLLGSKADRRRKGVDSNYTGRLIADIAMPEYQVFGVQEDLRAQGVKPGSTADSVAGVVDVAGDWLIPYEEVLLGPLGEVLHGAARAGTGWKISRQLGRTSKQSARVAAAAAIPRVFGNIPGATGAIDAVGAIDGALRIAVLDGVKSGETLFTVGKGEGKVEGSLSTEVQRSLKHLLEGAGVDAEQAFRAVNDMSAAHRARNTATVKVQMARGTPFEQALRATPEWKAVKKGMQDARLSPQDVDAGMALNEQMASRAVADGDFKSHRDWFASQTVVAGGEPAPGAFLDSDVVPRAPGARAEGVHTFSDLLRSEVERKGSPLTVRETLHYAVVHGEDEVSTMAQRILDMDHPALEGARLDIDVGLGGGEHGVYDIGANHIGLARTAGPSTIVHEASHAITAHAVRNVDSLSPAGQAAVRRLQEVFEKAQGSEAVRVMGEGLGLDSLDEFIAEAYSNPKFQAGLRGLQVAPGKSAWRAFVDAVAEFLGLRGKEVDALEHVLSQVDLVAAERGVGPGAGGRLYSRAEDLAAGDFDVALTVDKHASARLEGDRMYAGSISKVAEKELVQNAFDGTKEAVLKGLADAGRIHITINPEARTIEILDNGIGMRPQTVREAFFRVGGTKKDLPLSMRSGGFGKAKLQYMSNTEWIELETVHDGVRSRVRGTPEELLSETATLRVTVDEVAPGAVRDTSGTHSSFLESAKALRTPEGLEDIRIRLRTALEAAEKDELAAAIVAEVRALRPESPSAWTERQWDGLNDSTSIENVIPLLLSAVEEGDLPQGKVGPLLAASGLLGWRALDNPDLMKSWGVSMEDFHAGAEFLVAHTPERVLKTLEAVAPPPDILALGHGTRVTVKIPETRIVDGEVQEIDFTEWSLSKPLGYPIFGNTVVTIQTVRSWSGGSPSLLPYGILHEMPPRVGRVGFDWGDVDVYARPSTPAGGGPRGVVLSAGVYQFDQDITGAASGGGMPQRLPYEFVLDIKPKVEAQSVNYPISNERERFNGKAGSDIQALLAVFSDRDSKVNSGVELDAYRRIRGAPRSAVGSDLDAVVEALRPNQQIEDGFQRINAFDPADPFNVVIKDARVVSGHEALDAAAAVQKDTLSEIVDALGTDNVPFYNGTDFDIAPFRGVTPTDPAELFSEFSVAINDLFQDPELRAIIDEVGGVHASWGSKPSSDLRAGVGLAQGWLGLNLRNDADSPAQVVFINPLIAYKYATTPERSAKLAVITALHEAAHGVSRNHRLEFISALQATISLYFNEGQHTAKVTDIFRRHWDTLTTLRKEFESAKDVGKQVQGAGHEVRPAGERGDVPLRGGAEERQGMGEAVRGGRGGLEDSERLGPEEAGRGRGGGQGSLYSRAATAGAVEGEEAAAAAAWRSLKTESPWFKRWFGGSKITDAEGKPLRVYHGTTADFETFDAATPSRTGHPSAALGVYFTSEPHVAAQFSRDTSNAPPFARAGQLPFAEGASTLPAFVSLKNPKALTAEGFRDMMSVGWPERELRTPEADAKWGFMRAPEEWASLRREWETAGHDGVIVARDPHARVGSGNDEWMGDTYIAFSPEQIKSATANRGTFSDDPRFLYSRAAPAPSAVPKPSLPEPTDEVSRAHQALAIKRLLSPSAETRAAHQAYQAEHPEVLAWAEYRSTVADAELAQAREAARAEYEAGASARQAAADAKAARYADAKATGKKLPPEERATNRREWFGDSAVTTTGEAGGKPLVVTHESPSKFSEFRAGEFGFHFGVGIPDGMFGRNRVSGLLRINNPMRMADLGVWTPERVLAEGGFSTAEQPRLLAEVERIRAEADAPTKAMVAKARASGDVATAEKWQALLEDGSDAATFRDRRGNYLASRPVHDALREKGYDGIVYRNEAEGVDDSYIAFEPQQFKSNKNVGTYDAADPRFLYSRTPGNQTDTPAFRTFIEGTKVVDETGAPKRLYHGTTHDFEAFDVGSGNVENHHGRGIYLTSASEDVGANYATREGPDLKSRIESQMESLLDDWDDPSVAQDFVERWLEAHPERAAEGERLVQVLDDGGNPDANLLQEITRWVAEQEIAGSHGGAVLPVYAAIKNPIDLRPGKVTRFDIETEWSPDGEDLIGETGAGVDALDAIRRMADSSDTADRVIEALGDIFEGFDAADLERAVRDNSVEFLDDDSSAGQFLQDVYRELGFDGIVIDAYKTFGPRRAGWGGNIPGMEGLTPGTEHWVAFEPTQVKSATGNRGTFDPKDRRLLYSRAPGGEGRASSGFYSGLRRAVESIPQERLSADQVWGAIAKGAVRPDEVTWTRLEQFLAANPRTTKQEVLAWLDENAVVVEEKTLSNTSYYGPEPVAPAWTELKTELLARGATAEEVKLIMLDPIGDSSVPAWERLFKKADDADYGRLVELSEAYVGSNTVPSASGLALPRYGKYQLSGGTNYRELLFKLPGSVYRSTHFGDDGQGLMAHARVSDRLGPNGEKILLVEEVQSDWHQAGRKAGYTDPTLAAEVARLHEARVKTHSRSERLRRQSSYVPDPTGQVLAAYKAAAKVALAAYKAWEDVARTLPEGSAPNAPFSKTWHELVMKRVLRMASEGDYAGVAWTHGVEQVRRYPEPRRMAVDSVTWGAPDEAGLMEVVGFRGGKEVFKAALPKPEALQLLDLDVAERIAAGDVSGEAAGAGMTLGGRGLKGFYDTKLPLWADKYARKLDPSAPRVSESLVITNPDYTAADLLDVPAAERPDVETWLRSNEAVKVHYLPVTPRMRERILSEGQPLFSRAPDGSTRGSIERAPSTTREGKVRNPAYDKWVKARRALALSVAQKEAAETAAWWATAVPVVPTDPAALKALLVEKIKAHDFGYDPFDPTVAPAARAEAERIRSLLGALPEAEARALFDAEAPAHPDGTSYWGEYRPTAPTGKAPATPTTLGEARAWWDANGDGNAANAPHPSAELVEQKVALQALTAAAPASTTMGQVKDAARYIIRYFKTADTQTLLHENAHLIRFLLGDDWMEDLSRFFDHTIDAKTKAPRLTRVGEEQFATALARVLRGQLQPHGRLRAHLEDLRDALGDIWLNLRGKPLSLPPGFRDWWDAQLDPTKGLRTTVKISDTRIGRDPLEVGVTVDPATGLPADMDGFLMEEKTKRANSLAEYWNVALTPGQKRHALGILGDDTTMEALDAVTKGLALIGTTQARRRPGFSGRLALIGTRSAVPEERKASVLKRARAALEDAIGGPVKADLTFNEEQARGLAAHIDHLVDAGWREQLPEELLSPSRDLSTLTEEEWSAIANTTIDDLAGPGSYRDRAAEQVAGNAATSFVYAAVEAMSSVHQFKMMRDALTTRFDTTFEVSKNINPAVGAVVEQWRRKMSDAAAQVARLREHVRDNTFDERAESLIRKIAKQLFEDSRLAVPPDQVDNLLKLNTELNVGGELPTLESFLKARDDVRALFQDAPAHGSRQRAAEADALTRLMRLTSSSDFKDPAVAASLGVIQTGLSRRLAAVRETGMRIEQRMSGRADLAENTGDPNVSAQVYKLWFTKDWKGVAKLAAERGQTTDPGVGVATGRGGSEHVVKNGPVFDPVAGALAVVTGLIGDSVLAGAAEDMMKLGLPIHTDNVNFGGRDFNTPLAPKDVGEVEGDFTPWVPRGSTAVDAAKYRERVREYMNAILKFEGVAQIQFDAKGNYLKRQYLLAQLKDGSVDVAAWSDAHRILDAWGIKSNTSKMVEMVLPTGEEIFIPAAIKTALDELFDSTAKAGLAWTQSSEGKPDQILGRFGRFVDGVAYPNNNLDYRGKGSLGDKVSRATRAVLALPSRTIAMARVGVTTGVLVPNPAFYIGNGFGGALQAMQSKGAVGTLRMMGRYLPIVGGDSGKVLREVFCRVWGESSGYFSQGGASFVATNGVVYSSDRVVKSIISEGLHTSQARAESAVRIIDDLRNHEGTFWTRVQRDRFLDGPVGTAESAVRTGVSTTARYWQGLLGNVSTAVDDLFRVATYVDELAGGAAPAEAAAIARRTSFDYGDLTDFEKTTLRRFIMFYTYQRRNADLFWWTMLNHPSRIMGQLRAVRDAQELVFGDDNSAEMIMPEYLDGRMVIDINAAVGDAEGLKGTLGVATVLPPLPAADHLALWVDIFHALNSSEPAAGREMLAKLAPEYQAFFVLGLNYDIFAGRDLAAFNTVPAWMVEMDRQLNGGVVVDDLFKVRKTQNRDPSRDEAPGQDRWEPTGDGAKWWWVFRNLVQVPPFGRGTDTITQMARADWFVGGAVDGARWYRESQGLTGALRDDVADPFIRAVVRPAMDLLPRVNPSATPVYEAPSPKDKVIYPRSGFTKKQELAGAWGIKHVLMPTRAASNDEDEVDRLTRIREAQKEEDRRDPYKQGR